MKHIYFLLANISIPEDFTILGWCCHTLHHLEELASLSISSALLVTDNAEILNASENYPQFVIIGFEDSDQQITNSFFVITALDALTPEYCQSMIWLLDNTTYASFQSGPYTYFVMGFADYLRCFRLEEKEPYLVPNDLKNCTDSYHQKRFTYFQHTALMDPFNCRLLVKSQDGIPLGTLSLNYWFSEYPSGYYLDYYVFPEHRQQGIGSSMIAAYIRHLSEAHFSKAIYANVYPDNLASIHLLQKCGFEIDELSSTVYEDTNTLLYSNKTFVM